MILDCLNLDQSREKVLLKNFRQICHGLSKSILIFKKLKKIIFPLSANSSLQYAEAVCSNKENKTLLGSGMMVLAN